MERRSKRMVNELLAETEGKNKTWDERFLRVAREISTWSSCVRFGKRNGAVIVMDNHILSTGYNGVPDGIKACTEMGYCIRKKMNIKSGTQLEVCYALHAEESALMNAAREGVLLEGATMYVLRQPCISCFKLLLKAGIKKVVYSEPNFNNKVYEDILSQANIEMVHMPYHEEDRV